MESYNFGKCSFVFSDKAKTSFNNYEQYLSLVFLCGCAKDKTERARDQIKTEIQKQRPASIVVFAEEFLDLMKGINALTLEKLLASISSEIIIVAESPGSLCELGLFTFDQQVAKKVLVIEDLGLSKNNSFINRGPVSVLNYLSSQDGKQRVFLTPFSFENDKLLLSVIPPDLMSSLVNSYKDKVTLKPNAVSLLDKTLVISDLLWLQMAILEAVYLCWAVEEKQIASVIMTMYGATSISLDLGYDAPIHDDYLISKVTECLTVFAEEKGLLVRDHKGFVHVRLSIVRKITSSGKRFASVIFEKKIIQLISFQRWRSRRFNYLIKRGVPAWDV